MLIKVEKNGQPLHILESELEIYLDAGYMQVEETETEEAVVETKTPAKKGKKATTPAVVIEPQEESDYDDDLDL
jgi:hypothetical protein